MDFSSKGVKKRHMGDEILCNMRARLWRNGTYSGRSVGQKDGETQRRHVGARRTL